MEDFLHVEESAFSGIGKNFRSNVILNRYYFPFLSDKLFILVIGFLGDQLTTRMAMNLPWIVEANPIVAWLMTRGLWLPLDIVLVTLSLSAHLALQRAFKMKSGWVTLSLPLVYGLVKFTTAVWNILLIFG